VVDGSTMIDSLDIILSYGYVWGGYRKVFLYVRLFVRIRPDSVDRLDRILERSINRLRAVLPST